MEKRQENFIIITAGGIGSRMKSEVPKQFLLLKGKPVLMQTVERFYKFDSSMKIILSLPENFFNMWKNLCNEYNFKIPHNIVKGGSTRFDSIKNALRSVSGNGFTAVHDGVRPLVSSRALADAFNSAHINGNAVLARKVVFSLRKISETNSSAVNRNEYAEIQTPQIFKTQVLKQAYFSAKDNNFTDDASVVEALGHKIFLSEGNSENIKITEKSDMIIAEALFNFVD